MKINFDKINRETGAGIFRKSALLHYIKNNLDYLETHNKNYTLEQMNKINILVSIFDNIEE